jgi:hypothetical protein
MESKDGTNEGSWYDDAEGGYYTLKEEEKAP